MAKQPIIELVRDVKFSINMFAAALDEEDIILALQVLANAENKLGAIRQTLENENKIYVMGSPLDLSAFEVVLPLAVRADC